MDETNSTDILYPDDAILDMVTGVLNVDDCQIVFSITPDVAALLVHLDGATVRVLVFTLKDATNGTHERDQ